MSARTILVVGGVSGIGECVVEQLHKREYNLIVTSRDTAGQAERDGIQYIEMDVKQGAEPLNAISGPLHGVVYCPGTITLKPFARMTDEDFQEDYEINLLGAVKVLRACLPALKRADTHPSVVLFSSVAAQTGMPFHASISAAKGAVEGLTRALAAEFAPHIRVNAIAPSLTNTRLAEPLISREKQLELAKARHPLKRIGDPQSMARVAVFLLEDHAEFVTGQIFHIDGGLSSVRLFD